jgi:hypothetical protein
MSSVIPAISPKGSWEETSPPSLYLVTAADVRQQVNLGDDLSYDADITAKANAAERAIENYLQIVLGQRNFKYKFDETPKVYLDGCIPCDAAIRFPVRPIQSVSAVKYIDSTGATQTLVANTDFVSFLNRRDPMVAPAYGKTWPTARQYKETFWVEGTAGYDAPGLAALKTREPGLVLAICILAAEMFLNRSISSLADLSEDNLAQININVGHLRDVNF